MYTQSSPFAGRFVLVTNRRPNIKNRSQREREESIMAEIHGRSPKVVDYPAGGLTCPGVFLISNFVERIVYSSRSLFFFLFVEGAEACNPPFFLLLLLFLRYANSA